MALDSHILQQRFKLPEPATQNFVVQRDLRVPMADGVELPADRWARREGGDGLPVAFQLLTILILEYVDHRGC